MELDREHNNSGSDQFQLQDEGQSSSGATAAAVLDQKEAESPLETDHKKRKRGKKVPFKDLSEEQKKLRREKFRGRNQRRKEKKRALLELHSNLAPSQTTEQQHAYLGSSSQDNKDGGGTSQQNDSHAHQTSCAGKAKSAQAAVQELAVKSGSKERNSDTYQLAPFKIQIEKVGGVCTKKDFANVQQAFIKAVLSIPSGEARLAANPIRIRQSRLLDGKVVVIVWDSHSKDFIIEAITDLPDFSAAVQDGTARFSFIISSDWCYEKPADLIGVLERKNPRLPSGSLTFVSWTSRGPNGSRVFVDVNKEGISVLQDSSSMKSGQSEETFVNDSRNTNLSLGDVWYVISQKWFDRWNRHVKYDGDHPGPIDNHDILLNAEISEVRDEMLENIDFVFVPLECWSYLVKKYGTSSENTAIKRQVIEFGEFSKQLKIDLSGVKVEMVFGEIKIKRILSKSDTVEHLKELMDEVFHVKDTERRLWLKKLPNNYVLLKNDLDKLENFTLSGDNLVIILETKQSDGTWSEKYSSAAKVQTNFERNSSSAFGSHNLNHRSMETDTISTRSMTQANLTRSISGGLVGLNNLGNTCFMASALQCLSNIPALTQFFISDAYESEINEKNPIGNRGDLARAYGDLMKQMWCGNSSTVAPRHFKSVLGRCAPQFSGYLQQDSQELMAFLLDGLHEDLNRITNKPYINQEDAPENTADSVAAQRAWDNHKKRNDSIITDLFHGQYRSRLECPDCMKVSKIFDPLMYMSVSLPRKEEKIREIDIIWLDPERRRTRYKIITPREGQVIDLLYAAEKVSGLSADRMMLCELSQAIIESTISPTQKLRDIRDGRYSLCIFEREPQLPVIKVYNAYKGYTSYLKYFGNPLIMQIPKREMSFNEFVISLTTKMSRYVHLTEEAVQSEDSLPFKIKAVNQFGVEQSHDLCDEDDNLSVHMSSGKPVAYIALVWDMDAKDEYFKLDECNAVDYHDSYRTTKARKNEVLLEDCIEMYCKQETLNEDNMWYCPNCKDFKQASKKLDLWKLPKVLVIHLKRFCYSRHWRDKIETMVKFPLHDLSLKKFMLSTDQNDIKYDLRGVVNHYGGLGGGHYTAYCHSVADDKWHVYDDSHVASCTAEKCNSPSAYVLFYTQQEGSRLNGSSNGFEPMDVN